MTEERTVLNVSRADAEAEEQLKQIQSELGESVVAYALVVIRRDAGEVSVWASDQATSEGLYALLNDALARAAAGGEVELEVKH